MLGFCCHLAGATGQWAAYTDATASAGIRFTHVSGARGNYLLPETLGAGGAFFDYDNDGRLDLYLVNSGDLENPASIHRSVLYRNIGDGVFADVTDSAGVGNAGRYGMGCAVGDYDNDGDSDLYVTNYGANVLYRNDRNGMFQDVTAQAGVGDALWSSSATFLDADRDGWLDLFVVNYVHYDATAPQPPCVESGIQTYCHPRHFDGAPDHLFRNNRDGTFTDVSVPAGIRDAGGAFHGKGLGVVAADFNNDGWTDIYVANDDTPNYLFMNQKDGTFVETGVLAGCAYSGDGIAQAGMGVDAGDYDGDGWMDIFVTNLSYETNTLYRNNRDGTFTDATYEARLGSESYLFVGFGTGFLDADNDGLLDLFVANGHILDNIEQMTDVLTYEERNQLFQNAGDGTFTETPPETGDCFRRERVSRGAVFGDYDNDGDTDIVVTNSNQPAELWRNDTGQARNWLRVRCEGTAGNRDGIGARVLLTVGGKTQAREVHAGASYLSSNDSRLLFGLGDRRTAERLEIRWLSGASQVFENVSANQELVIVEPADLSK